MREGDYCMKWFGFHHLYIVGMLVYIVRGSRIHASLIKAATIELLERGCGYIPPQLHRDPSPIQVT